MGQDLLCSKLALIFYVSEDDHGLPDITLIPLEFWNCKQAPEYLIYMVLVD